MRQTLCASERFFHHPKAITHILSASYPLSSPSSSDAASLLHRLSLSFLNARHCISLEYTHAGGDLLHPPPVGPPLSPLVLAEDYVPTDTDALKSSKVADGGVGGRGGAAADTLSTNGTALLKPLPHGKVGAEGKEKEEGLRETVLRLQREVEYWKDKARRAGVDVEREPMA